VSGWGGAPEPVELRGQVIEVTGGEVRIQVEGDQLPQVGDPVRITFRIPGGPEVNVGTGTVSRVSGEDVWATATGSPQRGQLATIPSANPSPRRAAAAVGDPSAGIDVTRRRPPLAIPPNRGTVVPAGKGYVLGGPSVGMLAFALSYEEVRDFRAAVRLRAENVSAGDSFAGVSMEGPGLWLLFGCTRGRAQAALIEMGSFRLLPGHGPECGPAPMALDIERRGARYVFRADGAPVGEWSATGAPRVSELGALPTRVAFSVANGARAELLHWSVTAFGRVTVESSREKCMLLPTCSKLGAKIRPLTDEVAGEIGLAAGAGVLVVETLPGSPAQQAGLAGNDVILRYDGQQVTEPAALTPLVLRSPPGGSAELVVFRGGSQRTVRVTFGTPTPFPQKR
jgi:hypothetical protein